MADTAVLGVQIMTYLPFNIHTVDVGNLGFIGLRL